MPAMEMRSNFPTVLGIVIVLFIFALVLQSIRLAYHKDYRAIPGPFLARFTQWWRVAFVWAGDAHKSYIHLHDQYGPIVRTAPKAVDVSDPSVIPKIYPITSKYLKSDFYKMFHVTFEGEVLESMFSTQDPDFHRALKRPVAQKFSMSSMRGLEEVVDPNTDRFAQAMMRQAGEVVDFGAWLQWYAFDVIGCITFDRPFGFLEHGSDFNNMIAGLEFGLFYGAVCGQVPWLNRWLLGNPFLKRLTEWLLPNVPDPIRTSIEMCLDSIRAYDELEGHDRKRIRKDFLAFLRQQVAREDGIMTTADLMNHLTNNLLAGSDTTAISLRSVFYHVMRDDRVYALLRKEIDEADAAGRLSPYIKYEESLNLPYLQACIKEALRIHPGVSFPLERLVPEGGVELCGLHLPEGTIVGVNPAVIHQDQAIFGNDASSFRPERWLASDADEKAMQAIKNMDRHLLTFGAGARTCIGKNISMLEMGKIVPQLLRQFDIEWAGPIEGWTVSTFWFSKQSNVLARLTPRRPPVH